MKKIVKSIEELQRVAENFIESLSSKNSKATVVGLVGDLGSGKTTFVQRVAKVLGIKETLNSPTFVIQKRYSLDEKKNGFENLIHIDAYRLESKEELLWLGWNGMLANPKNLILIEWPEKVKDVLGEETKEIDFKFIDEKTRELKINNG